MSQFLEAVPLFRDNLDTSSYLDSFSFERARKELLNGINSPDIPLIFLLGDPGSGKSFLLNFIKNRADRVKVLKFYNSPNFTNKELLEALLEKANVFVEPTKSSLNTLIEKLKEHYKDLEYSIFIDEAQLMDEKQLEFLRVLSDQKIVKFVLSMHKKEGSYILSKPQFRSRTTKNITLEALTKEEINRYIQKRLLSKNLSSLAPMFDMNNIGYLFKLSKGNFRTIKKLARTVCQIANLAEKARLKQYSTINNATLTMAAIDMGLINVKS